MDCLGGQEQNPKLTGRERDIVALLFDGCSNHDIGDTLNLSPLTVRDHITRLLRKFQARNRTELLVKVIDQHRRQHRRLPP